MAEVRPRSGRFGVITQLGTARDVISRKSRFDQYSLVYTLGLYDYFSDRVAKRLTKALFATLASEGKLLIANFMPSIRDVGCVECFLDWWLVYLDRKTMEGLVSEVPESKSQHIFLDPPLANCVLKVVQR